MLSDVTIMILSVFMPILSIFCFIKGYNIGAKETKKPEIKVETPKQMLERHREDKANEQKRRKRQILLENIDAFDGTSKGQKEFK